MLTIDAILLGGGLGRRFSNPSLPKQFQLIGTAPVFVHSLKALLDLGCLRQIVLVFPQQYLALAEEQLDTYMPPQTETLLRLVAGGERRQDSSAIGLAALEEASPLPSRVLIHDACRPYLSKEMQDRVKKSVLDRSYGAWVPVVPVTETLKRAEQNQVVETLDRSQIFRAQTPQIFEYTVIRSLAQKAKQVADHEFTDDASLCEYYGIPVGVFTGDVRNLKLTYDHELAAAHSLLLPATAPAETQPCAPESATTFTV